LAIETLVPPRALTFLCWRGRRLERLELPAVGGEVSLPREAGPFDFLLRLLSG
jgi:hypothetical protein